MNNFLTLKEFPRKKLAPLRALCLLLTLLTSFALFGCRNTLSYLDYVSELRSNVFCAQTDGFSLRIYAVKKESPYAADGVPQASSQRVEAYLVAPAGNQTVCLQVKANELSLGGEMSYDNVKGEYFYSCTADISQLSLLDCKIVYGEQELSLSAQSVRTETTLSPQAALDTLVAQNGELFASLTDKYGFAGEIHLRLIYEDAPYYYAGVMDRQGKVYAFLMNAESGKILARRES